MRILVTMSRLFSLLLFFILMSASDAMADTPKEADQGLVVAAQKGDLAELNRWLKQGADVNARDADGNTALLVALINRKVDCALKLIDKNADLKARDMRPNYSHATVLGTALFAGTQIPHKACKNLIVALLKKGADVNAKSDRNTPLMDAAYIANKTQASDIFRILLAHGANVHARSESGDTMLRAVLEYPGKTPETEIDMVKALIEKGANPLEKDKYGNTVLALASCGQTPGVVKLLLDRGDDVNRADDKGLTPLLWACSRQGSISVIKMLLDRGANINAKDKRGQSALAMVSQRRGVDVARLLLARGAKVDSRGEYLDTPLMWGANHRHLKFVQLLVKHGAAINAVSDEGYSPLMWAVREFSSADDVGSEDYISKAAFDLLPMIAFLVQYGADVNTRNKEGQTALSIAKRSNKKAAEWLRQHGAKE